MVVEICAHLHKRPGHPHGRWITQPIANRAEKALPQEALEIVAWYATESPDPMGTEGDEIEVDGKPDIFTSGINSVRGAAATSIASLIGADSKRIPFFREIVERLVEDPSIAVQATASLILCNFLIYEHERDEAVSLFLRLCHNQQRLLGEYYVVRFLRYALQTHYSQLEEILKQMVTSSDPKIAESGAIEACLAGFTGEAAAKIAAECTRGTPAQRKGAAKVYAANGGSAEWCSLCEEPLRVLFHDPDPEVRKEAAKVFSDLRGGKWACVESLLEPFLDSPAFADDPDSLFESLKESPVCIPKRILAFAESCIQKGLLQPPGQQSRLYWQGDDLVGLLLRLYNQSLNTVGADSALVQERCLDIFDKLLDLQVYGVAKQLTSSERDMSQ
jgi:hypothetical protein